MKKETLQQRLAELDNVAQQTLANYNALLGAKNEVQNLINYIDQVAEKEKLEKEVAASESAAVLDHAVNDNCCPEEKVANGN